MKGKMITLMIAMAVMFFGTVYGQGSQNMTLLSNYGKGEGESKAVFAAGSLVFYGLGNKVQIVSYTNPSTPVKIASVVVTDVVEDLVRTSIGGTQYVVAVGGSRMWLINVQNPTAPSLVANVEVAPGTTVEGCATGGTYAYLAAGGGGLKIYNIATPASPSLVASLDTLEYCESAVVSGQYLYVAAGSRSHIVDISNPAAPVYTGFIPGYGGYHQYMNVRSGYAYICDYDAGLQVVNVSNPANPVNVTTVPSGYRTARIVFDGNYGYVAVGDSGVWIYNVANPASPVLAAKAQTTGRAASLYYGAITVGGVPTGHIYVSNRNPAPGLSAINVSNPLSPVTSSFLAAVAAPSGTAYIPYYHNDKVYVAYGSAGLRIIDVSNPNNLTLLGTANLGGDSRAVVASGNYAYVAARDSGVYIVDVTNSAAPVKVKTIKTTRARGISIKGSIVYVAASDSGAGMIDISNPGNPVFVGYAGNGVYGENIAVDGNVLGLTDYSSITFYDLTNPTAPVIKGSITGLTVGNEGFAISGSHAYIPDGDSLKIYNISNLMAPAFVSKVKTGGYGYMASVDGNYCYVASEGTGVRAIDISNPAAAFEAGYYDGVPQSRGLTTNGKFIYVSEKTDGLTAYSNDLITSVKEDPSLLPDGIVLYQNYPNPFNPSTKISVELKDRADVLLEIINPLGQEVKTLWRGELPAGLSTIEFDGSSVPSGLYFYRLSSNGNSVTRKMMLLK
ncbi:MAG: T9SS type A sorting domain-containing protein [Ignavibacteriaceae bacterium]|nr:T9SS type A sorting domain-containing protein [Ignavibacteriaceae bacterium]